MELAPHQIYRLCVPEVVVRELANHYRERLQETAPGLGNVARSIGRLLNRTIEQGVTSDEISSAISSYETHLRQLLASLDIHVEPLPTLLIGVEILLERDLRQWKPFGERQSGMRDALIWESILALCRREPRSLGLITGTTQDFADDSKRVLHADLLDDFNHVRVADEEVAFSRSIKEFNDARLAHSGIEEVHLSAHATGESRTPEPPVPDSSQ